MVINVARSFTSTYGIGITGYAAPVPERNIQRSFAHYSICKDGDIVLTKRIEAQIARTPEVQLYYMEAVLQSLLETLG
jgi:nicotinamide-nucleotide amidase